MRLQEVNWRLTFVRLGHRTGNYPLLRRVRARFLNVLQSATFPACKARTELRQSYYNRQPLCEDLSPNWTYVMDTLDD